jgi:hypothetical protein
MGTLNDYIEKQENQVGASANPSPFKGLVCPVLSILAVWIPILMFIFAKVPGIMRAIIATQRAGVVQNDINKKNFMLTGTNEDRDEAPGIVLLDFASAQSVTTQPGDVYNFVQGHPPILQDRQQAYFISAGIMGDEQAHKCLLSISRARKKAGLGEFEEGFWRDLLNIQD